MHGSHVENAGVIAARVPRVLVSLGVPSGVESRKESSAKSMAASSKRDIIKLSKLAF